MRPLVYAALIYAAATVFGIAPGPGELLGGEQTETKTKSTGGAKRSSDPSGREAALRRNCSTDYGAFCGWAHSYSMAVDCLNANYGALEERCREHLMREGK